MWSPGSTDLTDAEWAITEPLLPLANPLGRPWLWSLREIVNGIFYVLPGGVPWRLMPKDLLPKSTVCGYFSACRDSGLFAGISGVEELRIDNGSSIKQMAPSCRVVECDRFGELLVEGGALFDFCANAIRRAIAWARAVRPRDYLGDGPELVVVVPVTAQGKSAEDGLWTLKNLLEVEPFLARVRPVVVWNDMYGPAEGTASPRFIDLEAFIKEKGIASFHIKFGALAASEDVNFTELRTRTSADQAKITGLSIMRAHTPLHLFKVWLDASTEAARSAGLGPKKAGSDVAPAVQAAAASARASAPGQNTAT